MVLDEAATVASLDELDQLAATVSGLNVTLVTVVQDFAQLVARWGPRASTIVNNHTTRVVLGGLADPTVGRYLPDLSRRSPMRPRFRCGDVREGRRWLWRERGCLSRAAASVVEGSQAS